MDLALLVASAILATEIFLRLPLMDQVNIALRIARRSAATVRSKRISDHWKEKVLPAYSLRMAGRSIYFFLLMCLVLLPVALVGLFADRAGSRTGSNCCCSPSRSRSCAFARSSIFSCGQDSRVVDYSPLDKLTAPLGARLQDASRSSA